MSTLQQLREQRARIITNARAKYDEITDAMPEDRAAEVGREFDAMMADADKLQARIDRMTALDAAERSLAAGDPRRPMGDGQARGVDDGPRIDYRGAFHAYLRAAGNMADMEPEARAVLRAGFAPVEQRAQTTTAAAGGYTVPTELAGFITRSMLAWGPMYDPGVTSEIVTSGGNTIYLPTVNDTTGAQMAVAKHTEGTALTDDASQDVVFGQKQLDAYPFNTEWLRVSKELADDSIFNIEQLLGDLLGERLGRRANTELTTGDGSGDPNGIVTASSLGKTAASATAITADEIMDLQHAIDPAYRMGPKVAWMFNDATFAAIRKLKDGQGNYLWQMGDVRIGAPGTLLGKPYYINQAMASIATGAKSMIFGDLGKYYVRKVGGILIGAIQDKDFWPGFGIAGYIRFDGELADTAAVKHLIQA
jgi:HK97 family phage major capsid protein